MSSEGRCATCRHWSAAPNPDPRYEGSEHRQCSRMPSTQDMWKIDGSLDDDDDRDVKLMRERVSGAPYCGDLSGMGFFMTPPIFGCVLFEPGNAARAVDGGT